MNFKRPGQFSKYILKLKKYGKNTRTVQKTQIYVRNSVIQYS